jgi:hypothetical protein
MDTSLPPATPTPDPAPGLRVRVLPPEAWDAKVAAGELAHYTHLPNPTFTQLVVVEDEEGRIVGSWMAMNTVHLEGLYVAPEARRAVAVQRRLLLGMVGLLTLEGVDGVLTLAEDPAVAILAEKAGFTRIPGVLLQLRLRDPHPSTVPVEAPCP